MIFLGAAIHFVTCVDKMLTAVPVRVEKLKDDFTEGYVLIFLSGQHIIISTQKRKILTKLHLANAVCLVHR